MTYTCLGDDQYEIKLIIYVDCGPTNTTGITFDSSGILSIYDSENNLVQEETISDAISYELDDETVGNDCLELPTDLCILRGEYTKIITLPPLTGGYQIAYQRCCRNPSIINIPNPDDFGSTFTTNIPGPELVSQCNNSPQFNAYPPLALCIGDEINVDLSATDADGDSLSYELTTPYHGANDFNPTEITPPPFTPIVWDTGYSESYPMDSSPAINIDSQTGFITGTPTQMGMYIIGIKVSEYRDGVLINEIIRDFRFLVVDCNVTTSSFPLTSWYCNSFTVDFENQSYNANTFLWDFGVGGATSTDFEPSFTYPGNGNYTVTLIANPNTVCADTNQVTFPLLDELETFFENPDPQCIDYNNFSFEGEGLFPDGAIFSWNFGANANPSSSNQQNPNNISFNSVGNHPVSFNVTFDDCDETYDGVVEVFEEDIFPVIPSLGNQCFEGNAFDFTADGVYPEEANFFWDFGPNASPQYSTTQHPIGIHFTDYGTHEVSLTVTANACDSTVQNTIGIHPPINLDVSSSPPNGCEPFTVDFESNLNSSDYSFSWDLDNGETSTNAQTSATYMEGVYDISIQVQNNVTDCIAEIDLHEYVNVLPQPISNFEVSSDFFWYGDPVWITNYAQHSDHYKYKFSSGYVSYEEEPNYSIPSVGDFTIWQYAMNEYECVDSSSTDITVEFQYTFWTPNVFTPDNDNVNDYFFPVHKNVTQYRLQIFNRWGELIFDELGENPKWDGNYQDGKQCHQDSYVYLIKYQTDDTYWHDAEGVVNLIR
jgi:gliding motility-associated-like protein